MLRLTRNDKKLFLKRRKNVFMTFFYRKNCYKREKKREMLSTRRWFENRKQIVASIGLSAIDRVPKLVDVSYDRK